MNIETGIENKEAYAPTFEVGTFEDIASTVVFSIISKHTDNNWGNEQSKEFADDIRGRDIHLDKGLHDAYRRIKELAKGNEETLQWLAFVAEKDAQAQLHIVEHMIAHKGFTKETAVALLSEFKDFYQRAKQSIDLSGFKEFVDADIANRIQKFPRLREKIGEAIDFFKPKKSSFKKIVYLPTNPLAEKLSGYGIEVGEDFYISAESGNEINEIHEFLHSIINPIIEHITLTGDEETRVLTLCPDKLKDYKYPISILIEEIIRTYRTGFRPENEPSLENFKKKLLATKKEDLENVIAQEKRQGVAMAQNAAELIGSDEMIARYYEKYAQDRLAERIWKFFEEYQKSGAESFEQFFMHNYRSLLV